MGRKLEIEWDVVVLGIGVTLAFFHSVGICPQVRLSLKSLVILGATSEATAWRRWAEMPSTPVALWGLSFFSAALTSSSSMVRKWKVESTDRGVCMHGWLLNGVTDAVKWVFNYSEMSEWDVIVWEPIWIWDIWVLALRPRVLFSSPHTFLGSLPRLLHNSSRNSFFAFLSSFLTLFLRLRYSPGGP